jgi:hypothetical protein
MGLIIGNRALQGGPMLPYTQDQQLSGQDVFLPFVFLDRTGTPVVPTSIQVELDDLTNSVTMDGGPNTLNPLGSATGNYIYPVFANGDGTPWLLQLAASMMQMTFPYEGSQICKLKMLWKGNASDTGNAFSQIVETIIELVSSPTVTGIL